ncbi:MAG: GIY-YIG nuclease family protein [Candidatus Magasanikbacteria bacterium]
MEGFVYILQSEKNGSYYVGSTINLEKRIFEHNTGQTKSLKYLLPLKLVFFQKFGDIGLARALEYKIKNFKSRKIIEQIIVDQKIKMGR